MVAVKAAAAGMAQKKIISDSLDSMMTEISTARSRGQAAQQEYGAKLSDLVDSHAATQKAQAELQTKVEHMEGKVDQILDILKAMKSG